MIFVAIGREGWHGLMVLVCCKLITCNLNLVLCILYSQEQYMGVHMQVFLENPSNDLLEFLHPIEGYSGYV